MIRRFFHPDHKEQLTRDASALLKAENPFRDFVNTNTSIDGEPVVLSTSALPQFDRVGTLTGFIGMDTDITYHNIQSKKNWVKTKS